MTFEQARNRFIRWALSFPTLEDAANQLGCTKGHVCHVIKKRRGLGLRIGLRYQQIDPKVPVEVWDRAPKKKVA